MNETRDLSRWITGLKLGDVPSHVIDYAKVLLLDTLGCMLGGSLQESNRAALRVMRQLGGAQATLGFVYVTDLLAPFADDITALSVTR